MTFVLLSNPFPTTRRIITEEKFSALYFFANFTATKPLFAICSVNIIIESPFAPGKNPLPIALSLCNCATLVPSTSSQDEVPSISRTTLAVGFSSTEVSSAYAFVESKTNADIERHNARIIAMSTLFLFESLFTIFPPTPLEYFLGTFLPLRDFSCEARETGYPVRKDLSSRIDQPVLYVSIIPAKLYEFNILRQLFYTLR